uniref:Eukaryotic translation initiation factor 2 subunit 2 n=1 Tax=Anopheles triannulatus TaxID=58253 RepID=A0A2M4A2T0_9DIPT
MAEEDAIFDPSLMKKKKKKKTPFDLDAAMAATEDSAEAESAADGATGEAKASGAGAAAAGEDEEDLDLENFSKKKKKKKKDLTELMEQEAADGVDGQDDDKDNADENASSWAGSDRDYTYDELLNRVFEIILDKNPEMAGGRKPKFVMRPPQVLRVGTKKTSFANFTEICKTLHRLQKHLLDFLLAELGTSGSVDGNNQLIIKGRFQPKQIENVLRRYIKEYVTCHTCRSPDTILQKDTRLFFLQCESCGSRCSVASIKSGFQAVTSKRAAMRAKTA